MGLGAKLLMPSEQQALPGRDAVMPVVEPHFVSGISLQPPFPAGMEQVQFGMGCFWGAERRFWQAPGVYVTAVGYSGGFTPNPSYEEVCSGGTAHSETVLVVYDPQQTSLALLLKLFWESHDPTQGMRQGNDLGTQYRSIIYTYSDAQAAVVEASRAQYQAALTAAGYGEISTEIRSAPAFYYAEHYHQQYLAKVPNGYCNLNGTGVGCDLPTLVTLDA